MGPKTVTLSIFFCGIFQNIPIYLLYIATEDIVAGTLIQSSVVVSLFSTGDILTKLCSPFLIQRFHLSSTVVLSALMWLTSWVLIVVGEDAVVRLAGVIAVGILNGLLITIVMTLLSLYQDIERNASAYSIAGNATTFLTGFLYTSKCHTRPISVIFKNYLGYIQK